MDKLTAENRKTLQQHETVIDRGLATFLEVGQALKEIRDCKLYQDDYETFEKYVVKRWDMGKSHAYRLIDAAEVKDDLSPIGEILPTNEAQYRELAKVPDDQVADVWKSVVSEAEGSGEAITAKKIKNKIKEVVQVELVKPSEVPPDKPKQKSCKCPFCDGTGKVEQGEIESKFEEIWAIVREAGKKTRIADPGKSKSKQAYQKAIKSISRGVSIDGQTVQVRDPHGFLKSKIQIYVNSKVGKGQFCPQFTTLISREFWNQDEERWSENSKSETFVASNGSLY